MTPLASGPAAVHAQMSAGHLSGGIGTQEYSRLSQLIRRNEIERRLLLGEQLACGSLDVAAVLLCQRFDLTLHQGGAYPARADSVAGDALTSGLQGRDLGQTHDAMLGRHVG